MLEKINKFIKKTKQQFLLKVTIILFIFGVVYFVVYLISPGKISIIKDISKSLPHKMYLGYSGDFEIKKGDIILLKHPNIGGYLIKKITGMQGDRIDILDDKICINDKYQGSILKRKLNTDKMITPIKAKEIETDYYFVCGTHEESFDSRYEEFGLVKKENIEELLGPIF